MVASQSQAARQYKTIVAVIALAGPDKTRPRSWRSAAQTESPLRRLPLEQGCIPSFSIVYLSAARISFAVTRRRPPPPVIPRRKAPVLRSTTASLGPRLVVGARQRNQHPLNPMAWPELRRSRSALLWPVVTRAHDSISASKTGSDPTLTLPPPS